MKGGGGVRGMGGVGVGVGVDWVAVGGVGVEVDVGRVDEEDVFDITRNTRFKK